MKSVVIIPLCIITLCFSACVKPLLDPGKGYYSNWVYCFAVSGTNIFAGAPGGVFLSTNNGTTWTSVSTGLKNDVVSALAVSGENIFAGTNGGVFLSTDNGTSWTSASSGLAHYVEG